MAFDAHKNFAYSTVATAPSPATSGTSLVVAAGDGAKFPTPPFNATVWPVGAQPTTTNAEIVRVTNIATDTLTITRTQESTSARTVVVGDQIADTITVKDLTDIEALVSAAANSADVHVYGSAGGSWSKPSGAKVVEVVCIGSGGQGGGGASGPGATATSGGGGGGGGAVARAVMQASDVPGSVTVTVGAGGSAAGGPGAPAANGSDGAATTFGALLFAGGGGGGVGGKVSGANQGGSGGSVIGSAVGITAATFSSATTVSAIGGQGSATPSVNLNGFNAEWGGASGAGHSANTTPVNVGGSSVFGGAGGGSGGGTSTTTNGAGGNGGATQSYTAGGGGAGGAGNVAGTGGTSFLGPFCGTAGGGGGSGAGVNPGKDGGSGGIGCGGGGAGSALLGTGGTGGAGGDGRCIVITYF